MPIEPLWLIKGEVRDLLPAFLTRGHERLSELAEAAQARDFPRVENLAQGLNGSAALYSLSGFRKLGEELEQAANRQDIDAVYVVLGRLHHHLESLEQAVERFGS